MRSIRNRIPRWSILNGILLIAVGGLTLTHNLHLTPTGHKIALFLIIAAVYGLLGLWLKSNTAAYQERDRIEYWKKSRDPAVYGTREVPTRTQAHFWEIVSSYQYEEPDKRERL